MKKTTSVHRRPSAARALGAALLTAVLSESALAAVIPIKDARMKTELNATDGNVGIQLVIDADPWKTMEAFDPMGIRVFSAVTSGRVGLQGGTEFFMGSAEPSFRARHGRMAAWPHGHNDHRGPLPASRPGRRQFAPHHAVMPPYPLPLARRSAQTWRAFGTVIGAAKTAAMVGLPGRQRWPRRPCNGSRSPARPWRPPATRRCPA